MSTIDDLYTELKGDIALVSRSLFSVSEAALRRLGNFLPHGVVLTNTGEIKMVAAAPRVDHDDLTNAKEVLPLLHDGLRAMAAEPSVNAIGVAENVTVTFEGQRATQAIKVLFEHRRGLTVALYLPFEKKLLKGYVFGNVISKIAPPEVSDWAPDHA